MQAYWQNIERLKSVDKRDRRILARKFFQNHFGIFDHIRQDEANKHVEPAKKNVMAWSQVHPTTNLHLIDPEIEHIEEFALLEIHSVFGITYEEYAQLPKWRADMYVKAARTRLMEKNSSSASFDQLLKQLQEQAKNKPT